MSDRTRSRRIHSRYFLPTVVLFTRSVFKVKNPRREWWLDCSLVPRKIAQSLQTVPFYFCRTISLADDQHLVKKGALQGGNVKSPGPNPGELQMITPPMPALADRPHSSDNVQGALMGTATPQQTMTWLQTNRFAAYLHTFASFSGADLMHLTRDDLIQICGLADGIRLFNALHPRAKTVYLSVQQSPVVYQAVYLATLSSRELCSKVAALMGLSLAQLAHVYVQGPNGIHVVITDELVRNVKDESTFTTELITDQSGEGLCLLLKPPLSH